MEIATRSILAAALLVAAGAGTANAQVIDKMTFKTDFPFVAGNTTLPAGAYTVTPLDDDPLVLELSNGEISVLIETEGDRPSPMPSKSEVNFNKYDDTYVLHEIWDAEGQTGASIAPSRAEKRHQKMHGTPTPHALPATKTPKS